MIRLLLFLLFLAKNICALENIDFIVVNKEKRNITINKPIQGKILISKILFKRTVVGSNIQLVKN